MLVTVIYNFNINVDSLRFKGTNVENTGNKHFCLSKSDLSDFHDMWLIFISAYAQ